MRCCGGTATRLISYDGETTATEWARLGSGPNIRWEVIGCIANLIGLCATCLPSSDRFLSDHRVTRSAITKKMFEIGDACLSFCRECETLDDMFLWLLMDHTGVAQALKGNRHYTTYQLTGELNNAAIAMGLHQGIKTDRETPFFLAEIRKRAMIAAYCIEVSVATFLGRPPRLSYRYCILDPAAGPRRRPDLPRRPGARGSAGRDKARTATTRSAASSG